MTYLSRCAACGVCVRLAGPGPSPADGVCDLWDGHPAPLTSSSSSVSKRSFWAPLRTHDSLERSFCQSVTILACHVVVLGVVLPQTHSLPVAPLPALIKSPPSLVGTSWSPAAPAPTVTFHPQPEGPGSRRRTRYHPAHRRRLPASHGVTPHPRAPQAWPLHSFDGLVFFPCELFPAHEALAASPTCSAPAGNALLPDTFPPSFAASAQRHLCEAGAERR